MISDCKYCGDSARFISSNHSECQTKHNEGSDSIVDFAITFAENMDFEKLEVDANNVASGTYIMNLLNFYNN